MARSYRKPWHVDRNQFFRRYHNRRLRRMHWSEEIPDGRAFRKFGDPWDITDYRFPLRKPNEADLARWYYRWCLDPETVESWFEDDLVAYRKASFK